MNAPATLQPAKLVDITPFLRGFRKLEQAEIDAGNARIDKAEALLTATRALTRLLKVAKANGRPHMLIVKTLRAQLNIVREIDQLNRRPNSQ